MKSSKCEHKVESKRKLVCRILYKKIWKIDWSSFFKIMNEKDFNVDAVTRFQSQRKHEKLFLFFPFLKITDIWKQPLGGVL